MNDAVTPASPQPGVTPLVEHLFRHAWGRMVSRLVRHLGLARIDLAEEAVQHAMTRALATWPFNGVPDAPEAWLSTVARNRAIDLIRRDLRLDTIVDVDAVVEPALPREPTLDGEVTDDLLRLVFVCCHPAVPEPARLALTLKTVCGFANHEIARALLVAEATVAQRIVRAKRRLSVIGVRFEIPPPEALVERLASVRRVLYLLFNEGYAASAGPSLLRRDLAGEAIRLVEILLANPRTATPESHALAALMYLHAARFDARVYGEGRVAVMAEQDRSRWEPTAIDRGLRHLRASRGGGAPTRYHLEAGIAAAHATAPSLEETDWAYVLEMYDALQRIVPTPVVALNRAVALAEVEGPAAAMIEVERLQATSALSDYPLLHAVAAEFHGRLGRPDDAATALRRALALTRSEPERRHLERRLADLGPGTSPETSPETSPAHPA